MTEPRAWLQIRDEFARRTEVRREEDRQKRETRLRDERQRKDEREARDEQYADAMYAVLALASTGEIEAFRVRLDAYNTATVDALLANEAALKEASDELQAMFDRAHVLPDGRRVFETEDGTRVFDEHGVEITDVDPQDIGPERPRWEAVLSGKDRHAVLAEERRNLVEYQERVDAARDRLDQEDLTKGDLEELERILADSMPEAVRARLPAADRPDTSADANGPSDRTSALMTAPRLDMPTL